MTNVTTINTETKTSNYQDIVLSHWGTIRVDTLDRVFDSLFHVESYPQETREMADYTGLKYTTVAKALYQLEAMGKVKEVRTFNGQSYFGCYTPVKPR